MATPGRLLDLLENGSVEYRRGDVRRFAAALKHVKVSQRGHWFLVHE